MVIREDKLSGTIVMIYGILMDSILTKGFHSNVGIFCHLNQLFL